MKYKLLIYVLGLITTSIVILVTDPYGAGLTPDSVEFIAAARNMAEGKGLLMLHETPFVWWPPFYPVLLGTIDYIFKIDPLLSARIINAILLGLIVYLSGILFLKRLTTSIPFAIACTIYVAISNQLFQVSLMVLTEPLFIFFVLLFLIYVDSYLIKTDIVSLLVMSSSVALACLTRYIGVFLIVAGLVSILFFHRYNVKTKLNHLVLFLLISSLPISIWVIRNIFLTGTPFGIREYGSYTLNQNLHFTYDVFVSWYIPDKLVEYKLIVKFLIVLILFLLGISFRTIWMKKRNLLLGISPILIFAILYLISIIILSITLGFDKIDTRLLSPIFIPIAFLLFFFCEQLIKSLTNHIKPNLQKYILLFIVSVLAIISVGVTFTLIKNHMEQGAGYGSKSWRKSKVIEYLNQHTSLESGYKVYSNYPDAVYILTNVKSGKTASRSDIKEISKLKGIWPKERKALLLWFDANSPFFYSLDELQKIANVEQIARFNDGTINVITKKE